MDRIYIELGHDHRPVSILETIHGWENCIYGRETERDIAAVPRVNWLDIRKLDIQYSDALTTATYVI